MKNIVVHFFHGFLGNSHDWFKVQKALNVEVKAYDLITDLKLLAGQEDAFTAWANLQVARFDPNQKNIVVGYSLGGRQLLHLPSDSFEAALILAAHPGLEEGKEERLEQDVLQIKSLRELAWSDWLDSWNNQEVFSNDKHRPDRSSLETDREELATILDLFSLGRQDLRDRWLRANRHKIFWACGDSDSKFQGLKSRMVKLLATNHVFDILQSGHGVIFEQPEQVAHLIERLITDVC